MLSRTVRKSVIDTRWHSSALPPTFLLPFYTRNFNTTAPIVDGDHAAPNPPTPSPNVSDDLSEESALNSTTRAASKALGSRVRSAPMRKKVFESTTPTTSTSSSQSSTLHPSIETLLPLLKAQAQHYATIHIHGKPYLVTVGDTLRLPFLMPDVVPGDILRLDRATAIGSRDFTLKGAPYIDERLFECRARVMGVDAEPMRIKEKTKRRQRKIKTVRSKHKYTILRIAELKVVSQDGVDV